MSTAEELLDQERPPAYIFEKVGDRLIGIVLRYERGMTDYGERVVCVLVDDDGALHALWLLHAVLISQFSRVRPKVGDRIGVQYLGSRESSRKGQDPYKDFRVVSEGTGEPDWDAMNSSIDPTAPTG